MMLFIYGLLVILIIVGSYDEYQYFQSISDKGRLPDNVYCSVIVKLFLNVIIWRSPKLLGGPLLFQKYFQFKVSAI